MNATSTVARAYTNATCPTRESSFWKVVLHEPVSVPADFVKIYRLFALPLVVQMSNTANSPSNLNARAERRNFLRHPLKSLAYVEVGAANGGVILNLGEGGLAVQAVSEIHGSKLDLVRFQCEPARNWIETAAKIAWTSESRTVAGLEFVGLSDSVRDQIRNWIDLDAKGVLPESHARAAASATNKWSEVIDQTKGALRDPAAPQLLDAADPVNSMALLKRYLVEERNKILLHDLVMGEAERLAKRIDAESAAASANVARGAVLQRMRRYEELAHPLLSLMITGCYWGEPLHNDIWTAVIERVANAASSRASASAGDRLQAYPALLLLYGGGLASVAKEKFSTLQALLVNPRIFTPEGEQSAVHRLVADSIIGEAARSIEPDDKRSDAPASLYLHQLLRPLLREFLLAESDYDDVFGRFEYLCALVWVDENPRSARLDWVPLDAPIGLFTRAPHPPKQTIAQEIDRELALQGRKWPPLLGKMFGGHADRAASVKERLDEVLEERRSGPPPERF